MMKKKSIISIIFLKITAKMMKLKGIRWLFFLLIFYHVNCLYCPAEEMMPIESVDQGLQDPEKSELEDHRKKLLEKTEEQLKRIRKFKKTTEELKKKKGWLQETKKYLDTKDYFTLTDFTIFNNFENTLSEINDLIQRHQEELSESIVAPADKPEQPTAEPEYPTKQSLLNTINNIKDSLRQTMGKEEIRQYQKELNDFKKDLDDPLARNIIQQRLAEIRNELDSRIAEKLEVPKEPELDSRIAEKLEVPKEPELVRRLSPQDMQSFRELTTVSRFTLRKEKKLKDLNSLADKILKNIAARGRQLLAEGYEVYDTNKQQSIQTIRRELKKSPTPSKSVKQALNDALYDWSNVVRLERKLETLSQKESKFKAELETLQEKYSQVYKAIKQLNPKTQLPESLEYLTLREK